MRQFDNYSIAALSTPLDSLMNHAIVMAAVLIVFTAT